jgi:hypothetical protein
MDVGYIDLSIGLTQELADGTYTYLYGVSRIAQCTASNPQYFLGDALAACGGLLHGLRAFVCHIGDKDQAGSNPRAENNERIKDTCNLCLQPIPYNIRRFIAFVDCWTGSNPH